MSKLKKLSGRETVRILCNRFGFSIKRQRESHILLVKETPGGKCGCVVPLHNELKIGTLKGILG
jgi:predicted RNA binding protein YcfA (HicA-like mRNA interferase family)